MATRNQKGWGGRGPVVSVRGEPELGERLDALAERTNRSRGTYFRMTLWAALPSLERMHWEQVAADTTGITVTKTATFIRQRPPKPPTRLDNTTQSAPTQGAFFMGKTRVRRFTDTQKKRAQINRYDPGRASLNSIIFHLLWKSC